MEGDRAVSRWRVAQMILLAAIVILPAACGRRTGPANVTYYLSPSGNDAAAGTSPATAWHSLGRASRAILRPGTRLLLEGGNRFTGQLTLSKQDSGDAARPVSIGSYGAGKATIVSSGSAIYIHDTAGIDISDLNLIGPGSPRNSGAGIDLYSDMPAGHRLDGVIIHDVTARGFADGILEGGENRGSGFADVQVSNCALNGNISDGFLSYGPRFDARSPAYANRDIRLSHVLASANHGDPDDTSNNSGNGIVLGNVDGGTIAWSTADNNGGEGAAVQGPAGIWAYDSTNINIEHDLSFDNRTRNDIDGNGFGLDQNTSESVLQYDLSYGNAGAGFLVYSAQNNSDQRNNIVRYDISSDDSRDGRVFYGGITVAGVVVRAEVYQNTVVTTSAHGSSSPALRLGTKLHGVLVLNNIFAANYGPIVADTNALPLRMAELQGNDYFTALGPWSVTWGSVSYGSLSAWRAASSEEIVAGRASGFSVNPYMTGPVLGLHERVAGQIGEGKGFILSIQSRLVGAGLNLDRVGLKQILSNFAGRVESGRHPDVGAQ
jgi:hypothetical protein